MGFYQLYKGKKENFLIDFYFNHRRFMKMHLNQL